MAEPEREGWGDLRCLPPTKHFPMFVNLCDQVTVIADDHHRVAARPQFGAQGLVLAALLGPVVDAAVTKDADVRLVEEIGHAARFGDFTLGIVGQA